MSGGGYNPRPPIANLLQGPGIVPEYSDNRLLKPPLPDSHKEPGKGLGWTHLYGSATALAISEAARIHRGVMVVVLEDQRQLHMIENELGFFANAGHADAEQHAKQNIPVLAFPGWECLPYDTFSPHPDITSRRLSILSRLPACERAILLTTCANLMQQLPPVDYVLGHSFELAKQQRINLDTLREQLSNANYAAVQQVMSPGEFALRGGLVDIFPMGAKAPFRLDLFDDEIETIRYFDPDTQRSNEQVEKISLLPAREFPMTENGIKQFRQGFRRHFEGDPRAQRIYNAVSEGNVPAGAEFFLPLFFEHTCTLFDYLRKDALWILPAQLFETVQTQWAEIKDRYTNANYDRERKVLPPEMLYLNPDSLSAHLRGNRRIIHFPGNSKKAMWVAASEPGKQFPVDPRQESPYRDLLAHLSTRKNRVLLAVETAGRREAMEGVLSNYMDNDQGNDQDNDQDNHPGNKNIVAKLCSGFDDFVRNPNINLGICVYPLERGLSLPDAGIEVIAESQLYGEKVFRQRRGARVQDPESVIRSLAELHEGDPVVHIDHGVGRYCGLQFLDIGDQQSEFLTLEYQNGDKLYVPVLSMHLVSRFVGGSADNAPLHRLGGEQWQKARKRAHQKAHDVAAELLEMEALRNARKGRAFKIPRDEYQNFINRFAFEETPDQQRTINEVHADLESSKPMDRLVCGDVGFGKTEVALRAAFIVVRNQYQVAILTPTTLLARQHYETFVDRFADMSVSVDMLSRFRSKKQSTALVGQLKEGQPDIVIGTHRLLQNDIGFQNLGLLIIDEEHRFGVRQKEKIKQLRSQVDLLTLTATPIPRTLNITLAGLRAISLITTAPPLRLSIKTFIREWSRGLIREACLREIRRGGQVYFLHNEVRTMERFTMELAELIPEAEIKFGHGQMNESQLERVMQDFYHQRFNILVCSTIIESGLDIPSANTIIIHRADRFGLAQLHQLRGRVGRSHHQAFAYLLIPEREFISNDAKKRLDAFELMEELGAGFALASHDLEIRGAGELLGETQSGLIDDVGFSLYSEYLNEAVTAIRENRMPVADDIAGRATNATIDLHVPALFPADYLANPHARLMLYKRIAGAANLHELEELQIETIDRFGLLPDAGKNLFRLTALRLQSAHLGIRKLEIGEHRGRIEFTDFPAVDTAVILSLVQHQPHRYRLAGPGTLAITGDFSEPMVRISETEKLLDQLSASLVT